MRERFEQLCSRFGAADRGPALFTILEALHSHPVRAYHNLSHIQECLQQLEKHRGLTTRPDEVELALWLHDCVYFPGKGDNEARSAQIARTFCRELGLTMEAADRIHASIMATLHKPETLAGDTALVADLDMSILAAAPERYDEYAGQIRREFGFVPEAEFCRGRSTFLSGLLARPTIYHLPNCAAELDRRARANLAREIAALTTAL